MFDVLVVTSKAYSHRKIGRRLVENYFTPSGLTSMVLKITDDVPYDFKFRNGLFVITFDKYSLTQVAKFFPIVKHKILYVTLEGVPILDKTSFKILENVDLIVANSDYTRDVIEDFFDIDVHDVIKHEAWVVKPDVNTLNMLYRWKGDRKMVLWVSTNQHRKGLDKLVKITRLVAEYDDTIVFRVVTGLGEVNLKALGFSGNTYLDIRIESLSEEELAAYYVASDVVISTSYCEGFGMTINEALAYGKKVLTPRYRPFTEYVTNTVPIKQVYYVNYMGYMLMEYHDYSTREFAEKLIETIYKNFKCGEAIRDTYGRFLKLFI